jgi:hypothetical protein
MEGEKNERSNTNEIFAGALCVRLAFWKSTDAAMGGGKRQN